MLSKGKLERAAKGISCSSGLHSPSRSGRTAGLTFCVRSYSDPNKPKKPNTSYFQFVQQLLSDPERLSEIVGDEKSVIGRQKLMAQRWRSMTDQEKEVRPSQFIFVHSRPDEMNLYTSPSLIFRNPGRTLPGMRRQRRSMRLRMRPRASVALLHMRRWWTVDRLRPSRGAGQRLEVTWSGYERKVKDTLESGPQF